MKNTLVEAPICFIGKPSYESLKLKTEVSFSYPLVNIYEKEKENGEGKVELSYTVNIIAYLPNKLKEVTPSDRVLGAYAFGNDNKKNLFVSYTEEFVPKNTDISSKPINTREFKILYNAGPNSSGNELYHISFEYKLNEGSPKSQAIYVTTQQDGGSLIGDDDRRGTVGVVIKKGSGVV